MIELGLTLLCALSPNDWPNWRGPTSDGIAPASVTPVLEWSESKNVRWKIEIDGLGNSTPCIVGDRIYLTTAVDLGAGEEPNEHPGPQPEPPTADNVHAYYALALDRETGKEIWRTEVARAKPHDAQHRTGSHASASIAHGSDRLVAFFGSRGLYGLDLDGKVVWQHDLGDMKIMNQFGEGSTPVIHGDDVFVQWDEEGPSFIAAFALENGKERWRRERDGGSSWGSPTIAVTSKGAQVIAGGSDVTTAYDVESGSTVWFLGGFSKNPTASTLVHEGVVYAMNSYRGNVIQAVEVEGAAGSLDGTDAVLWTANRGAPYVPTPVAHDGLVYFLRDSTGILSCHDARTGEERYSGARLSDLKRIHASPTVAGDRLYVVGREGTTVVVRTGPEFEVLAENRLEDVFDASPVFVGDAIYLRGRRSFYCLGEPTR